MRVPSGDRETNRAFLGRGWRFPVETDDQDRIALSEGDRDIEESIRVILGTARGERVMRPDFGCGIHEYVFSTLDATTLSLIETSVRDALISWEPRIDVQSVEASAERSEDGVLPISIDYRVRRSNNEYNFVYPFYLSEG